MRRMFGHGAAATAVVFCLLTPVMASAQAGATLTGTTMSVDGARLPRASLRLVHEASGREYHGTSNDLGGFVFDRLPAGSYTLVVEFPGLAPRSISHIVIGESGATIDVQLEPMHVRELVTVSAAVPRDSVEVTSVRESAARDVGELMAETSGLWKLRKGGIANDVVLRGLQSRDLNVLLDGERLYGACPNHMDPPAFHVDFSQVERVDVGKGPFDVRYQGSLGGVVNIVTRRPDEGWHANAAFAAGSYGYINPSATMSYGGQRLSMLGGASFRRSGPHTDARGALMTAGTNYRPSTADSDAFRANTLWGRTAWRPAEGQQIEASYTRQRTDHVLYPYLQMDAVWDNADRLAVEYTTPNVGWFSSVKAQAYWSAVDHWMTDEYRTSSLTSLRAYSMGTAATTNTVGARVEARRGQTSFGSEWYRRNWNTETRMGGMAYMPQYAIPDVNIDSVGAFVEHTRPIGSKVALDVGGRVDHLATTADPAKAYTALYLAYHGTAATSRSDTPVSGRARVTVQAARGLSLAAAVGHTARVAEANERFYALRRSGTDWVGNPDLAPARNTGLDVSASFQRSRLTLSGNAYVNAVHNYIAVYGATRQAMVAGVMNASARSYANVDARLRGLEANGSFTLRPAWTVSGDVSYVRGTMTPNVALGITSTNLAETPPLRTRLRLRVDDGRVFGEVEGVASAAQTRVDASLGEAATPSWAILNVTSGVRRGRLVVTAGVANLLNAYYAEHLSYQRDPFRSGVRVQEPGRNVFTNVSWKF
ncbi:MAG: TonB-dependent receptor [Vicinamibacterales bacterium]